MTAFRGILYNIMPILNIPSVMEHGILSHNEIRRKRIPHESVADANCQSRRQAKVTNGLPLHEYANLYFDARNPMMYRRKAQAEKLCVLIIDKNVLNIENVVLTDRNMASGDSWIKFYSTHEIENLPFDKIYARYWIKEGHPSQCPCPDCRSNTSIRSAEVLVPFCVPFEYITGVHVVNAQAKQQLETMGCPHEISISPDTFFC